MSGVGRVSIGALLATAVTLAVIQPHASGLAQPARPAAAVDDGASLYQAKCGSCHSIAASKIGPAHRGVFGRRAGMVPGYKYSPALRASNITWDARTLDQWLQAPQKLVKGSKMYLVVPDPRQRDAIIRYLQSDAAK